MARVDYMGKIRHMGLNESDPVVWELKRAFDNDNLAITDKELWSPLCTTLYYHRNLTADFDKFSSKCGGVDNAIEITCPSRRLLTTEDQVVVRDVCIDRFCLLGTVMRGGWIDFDECAYVHRCYSKRYQEGLSVQLQAKFRDRLKCVHVVFRQAGKDIVARVDWASHTSLDRDIGYDFESEYSWSHDDHKLPIATRTDADGYGIARLRYCILPELQQCTIPAVVYKGDKSDLWSPSGFMGNVGALNVDANFKDSADSPCLKFSYASGDGWAGLSWQDPSGDWGERPGGRNLALANTLFFRARGEEGGEVVSFGIGGIADKMVSDTADCKLESVVLTKEWKIYRINLGDQDLSRIKTGFRIWVNGQGKPITFYIDHVFYDHADDSTFPGISRNALASLLERAEMGDPVAMYELGVREENGHDHKPDVRAAKWWYLKAIQAGEMRAYEALKRLI